MMRQVFSITRAMQAAFELVAADSSVKILDRLKLCDHGDAEFRCALQVLPFPNAAGLPKSAAFRVRLNAAFPYHGIEVYSESPEVRAFPHQDAETHKLCLQPERLAPHNVTRLKAYLDWTRNWLHDAATGALLAVGHPFELPDFSRRGFRKKFPTKLPLLFDESPETFPVWQNQVGKMGAAEIASAVTLNALIVKGFRDENGRTLREWTYPESLVNPKERLFGAWFLLPTLFYERHRPPQIFGELRHLCELRKLNLLAILRIAWEEQNKKPELAFVLVGSLIPKIVGEAPSEVHWQPLFFPSIRTYRREQQERHKRGAFKSGRLWDSFMNENRFEDTAALPWARSDNIARARLYGRGAHAEINKRKRIVIAGCGALGSMVAELIARGGAMELSLFDKDLLEMGNQCRHTLDGRDLLEGKATQLASRLLSCNPLSKIEGVNVALPPTGDAKSVEKMLGVFASADLVIDCSADEGAFRWLESISHQYRFRLASLFVNFRSTILTFALSGRSTSCGRVCNRLYQDIAEGITPVTTKEHGGEPENDDLVSGGAGCWQPTFPAVNADLWILACAGVNALNELLREQMKTDGIAVLFRRNLIPIAEMRPPVETLWVKKYR